MKEKCMNAPYNDDETVFFATRPSRTVTTFRDKALHHNACTQVTPNHFSTTAYFAAI